MKCSLAVALLAVASASAHDLLPVLNARLVERQDPSLVGSSLSSSGTLGSSTLGGPSTPTPTPTPMTTTQIPPSTISGAPGAIPINQITSGMSSGTPVLPSTTYPAGSRPTWDGAPPLPSACTSRPYFYRPRFPYALF